METGQYVYPMATMFDVKMGICEFLGNCLMRAIDLLHIVFGMCDVACLGHERSIEFN